MSAKKPVHGPPEIYRDEIREESFKSRFDLGVLQEVYKIIDIDAEGKRGQGWLDRGVGWVDEVAGKQAGVRCVVVKAKTVEDAFYLCVPVARAVAKAI